MSNVGFHRFLCKMEKNGSTIVFSSTISAKTVICLYQGSSMAQAAEDIYTGFRISGCLTANPTDETRQANRNRIPDRKRYIIIMSFKDFVRNRLTVL